MLKISPDQHQRWKAVFQEQDKILTVTAMMLLKTIGATEQILIDALAECEETPFLEEVAQQSAVRAVALAALSRNFRDEHPHDEPPTQIAIPVRNAEDWSVGKLPWAERAALYLRNVLCYSRSECASLLCLTDADIDQLIELAERRIGAL